MPIEKYNMTENEKQFLILENAQLSDSPPFDNIGKDTYVIFQEGLFVSAGKEPNETLQKAREEENILTFMGKIGQSTEEPIDIPTHL